MKPLFPTRGPSTGTTRLDGTDIEGTIRRALASAGLLPGAGKVIPEALTAPGHARIDRIPALGEPANDSFIELARPGQFVSRSFSNATGTRPYKLYLPDQYAASMPLIVMLHGCTQDPDDFAAGTRMNELANRHGLLVAYPEQPRRANGSNCWNWFRAEDQARDRGEPSLIAGITREIQSTYGVDRRRTFVAGLSAGAAMAVIMGATYPDLYAAIGVHSGLPYGAAHDIPSAFAAMRGPGGPLSTSARSASKPSPTIVFHGDQDTTVNIRNGTRIVNQLIAQFADVGQPVTPDTSRQGGHSATVTAYRDGTNRLLIEEWILHAAGHAWSGGSPVGSFTDATGPDASAEMVHFFLDRCGRSN